MITAYISIGNSDDKLPQVEWAAYAGHVMGTIRRAAATVHGEWTSFPLSSYQNACWCVEIEPAAVEPLKRSLASAAQLFRQDSIAWAEVTTEFIPGVSA
jgi:hypothetical protein